MLVVVGEEEEEDQPAENSEHALNEVLQDKV